MFTIKRSLAGGLVIAAASFPTAAHATFIGGGESNLPVTPTAGVPSASQPINQLQRNVQEWFAVHGRFPSSAGSTVSAAATAPTASAGGFHWGDAGIGAAGATVLLAAGVLGAGMTRRRRRVAVS